MNMLNDLEYRMTETDLIQFDEYCQASSYEEETDTDDKSNVSEWIMAW